MEELSVQVQQVSTCALSGGELTAKVNVGEACENQGWSVGVTVDMFYRLIIIVDDAVS
jgi:hypothetical protein